KISAGEMVHKRFLPRIVHGVSQVTQEDHILTLFHHLADRERTAKYAHILMHAHDHDVGDASLPHKVVGFRAVSDGITVPDFNGRDLMPPWGTLRALRLVIAPTVGVVDGQGRFLGWVEATPALQGYLRGRFWGELGEFAAGGAFVELHGVARAMNN